MHFQTTEVPSKPHTSEFRVVWHDSIMNDGRNSTKIVYHPYELKERNSANYRVLKHCDNGSQEVIIERHIHAQSLHLCPSLNSCPPGDIKERYALGLTMVSMHPAQKRRISRQNFQVEQEFSKNHRSRCTQEHLEMGKRPPPTEICASTCKRLKQTDAGAEHQISAVEESGSTEPSAPVPNINSTEEIPNTRLHQFKPACHTNLPQKLRPSSHHSQFPHHQANPALQQRKELECLLNRHSTIDNSSCFRAANVEIQSHAEGRQYSFDPAEAASQREERFLQKGANQLTLFMGELTPQQAQKHSWAYLNTFYRREQEHVEKNALIETYFESRKNRLEKLIHD
jgi:hypothetical protein